MPNMNAQYYKKTPTQPQKIKQNPTNQPTPPKPTKNPPKQPKKPQGDQDLAEECLH